MPRIGLCALLLAPLVAQAGEPRAPGQPHGRGITVDERGVPEDGLNRDEMLSMTFAADLHGGVAIAGCGFRGSGPPEATGTITIAGIPAGARIVKAVLNWTVMGSRWPAPMFEVATSTFIRSSKQLAAIERRTASRSSCSRAAGAPVRPLPRQCGSWQSMQPNPPSVSLYGLASHSPIWSLPARL